VGIALLFTLLLIGSTAAQARGTRAPAPKPRTLTYEWIPAHNGEPAALLRVAPELVEDQERATAAHLTWNPARGELTLEDRREDRPEDRKGL